MSLGLWIVIFILVSLYCKWVISWGGTDYIDQMNQFLSDYFFGDDSGDEPTKSATFYFWCVCLIVFLLGIFIPEFRMLLGGK